MGLSTWEIQISCVTAGAAGCIAGLYFSGFGKLAQLWMQIELDRFSVGSKVSLPFSGPEATMRPWRHRTSR